MGFNHFTLQGKLWFRVSSHFWIVTTEVDFMARLCPSLSSTLPCGFPLVCPLCSHHSASLGFLRGNYSICSCKNSVCPWKEVSSGSSHAVILNWRWVYTLVFHQWAGTRQRESAKMVSTAYIPQKQLLSPQVCANPKSDPQPCSRQTDRTPSQKDWELRWDWEMKLSLFSVLGVDLGNSSQLYGGMNLFINPILSHGIASPLH